MADGWEIHCFEDYSLKLQIQIMSGAMCLIGLHGAGLTNMLFMKEGSKVLELRNASDHHNNCYFSLASELNIEYYYQLNEASSSNAHSSDVYIDISELEMNLRLLHLHE